MSLLDELKNILLKNHYHLYIYIYLVKELHSFCLRDRGEKRESEQERNTVNKKLT